MTPLNVVCWKWKPRTAYRSKFGPETVNVLYRMVRRNFASLGRFICVTDDAKGIDSAVEIIPLWSDLADLPSPHGGNNPSCYRRLKAFAPEAREWFGDRFVSLDLDTVIVNDLTPLWDRPEDFVIWNEIDPRSFYNGSMWVVTAGARSKVWTEFNPKTSPSEAKAAGRFGSDQSWLSHVLGKGEATWSIKDGVYSYNSHIRKQGGKLPADARITMWHGGTDPWSAEGQRLDWVRRHWN